MRYKGRLLGGLLLIMMMAAAGCGGQQQAEKPAVAAGKEQSEQPKENIVLTVYNHSSGLSDEQFNKYKAYISQKFPYITLQFIPVTKGVSTEQLIASGTIPDIMVTGYTGIVRLRAADIPMDLNPFVKKQQFNLAKIDETALDTVQNYGEKGQLFALPFLRSFVATTYNKDIFDKFGIAYPKKAMSWDEALELGKKLTRNVGGIQYRGLVIFGSDANLMARGLSLQFVDPHTDKAVLNTDGWKQVLETFKAIYSIPGNENYKGIGWKKFAEGNIAMYTGWSLTDHLAQYINQGKTLNWDLAAYPHFKQSPGKTIEDSTKIMLVTNGSKHPDEAFRVISQLATAPDLQAWEARQGNMPTTKIKDLEKIFGQDVPVLKGKNIAALLQSTPRKNHMPTIYDKIVNNVLIKYTKSYMEGKMDVRSALAAAEEEANKQIAAEKE